MSIDSHMLLAKLYYACGQYDEAMVHCTEAKLNSVIQTELQIRNIRILAESFAVKGKLITIHFNLKISLTNYDLIK